MPRKTLGITPTIVANWKMQLGVAESVAVAKSLVLKTKTSSRSTTIVLAPSFPALSATKAALKGSSLHLGAQDVFWDDRGAYTGEVSPRVLSELGVQYVIIGHSERRQLMNETNAMVAKKMVSAVGHALMPILCVGETAADRRAQRHDVVVQQQLLDALRSLPPPRHGHRMFIAYEPIWAIGTGEAAEPDQARQMYEMITQTLVELFGSTMVQQNFRILYGGSVDANNVTDYVAPGAFQGALVGTASLDGVKFAKLIQYVATAFRHG